MSPRLQRTALPKLLAHPTYRRHAKTEKLGNLASALASCAATAFGSIFLKVPAPNTENDDHNPQRIQSRNLFDLALGQDNLFHGDRYKWSARVTVINVMNKTTLYNFLSTFSGTHYVTPRTETVELGFHF
jgi:hypothetical protein